MGACLPPLSDCPGALGTFRFDSRTAFYSPSQHLHPLTCYSVSTREFHFSVSPIAMDGSNGILTVSSIEFARRLPLRSRLTLIRLALIRNPWSFGEGVSRPLYRYLYLHLLFHTLQLNSSPIFSAVWNAPLPIEILFQFHVFGVMLMPDYYPRGITRLVSCYALFK